MSPLKIGINGCCGRMGSLVTQSILASPEDYQLIVALEHPNHQFIGEDIGEHCNLPKANIAIGNLERLEEAQVMIDFSMREASLAIAKLCGAKRIPLLVATTGHTNEQMDEILSQSKTIPLLVCANTSLVVNVLLKLSQLAGQSLKGKDFDVEIVERHHRHKIDAPSGTALKFAEVVQEAMGIENRVYGREGDAGPRTDNEIGIHAIRGGDFVGEHTVIFSTNGETMELVHRGQSRDSYVKGALEAAEFLVDKPAGIYSMNDVLGL